MVFFFYSFLFLSFYFHNFVVKAFNLNIYTVFGQNKNAIIFDQAPAILISKKDFSNKNKQNTSNWSYLKVTATNKIFENRDYWEISDEVYKKNKYAQQ